MNMKLRLCFLFCLCFATASAQQQAIWITATDSGNLYCFEPLSCDIRLKCTTGKNFMDIAFTPDGRLWGNTPDTLYEIDTADCSIRAIGPVPPGKALVGLNDSTLLIDSLRYLYTIKTSNAAQQLIGYIGRPLDGDMTWIGRHLYARGAYILKMELDSSYSSLLSVDTLEGFPWFTPAMASMSVEGADTVIVAIPGIGNNAIYTVNPLNAAAQLLCSHDEVKQAYGATCMIFPPPAPSVPVPVPVAETKVRYAGWTIYPNPASDKITVSFASSGNTIATISVQLFDPAGRLLQEQRVAGGQVELSLGTYPRGLYLLRLQQNDRCIGWQKIVKQ